jgi:protein-S-isoprenylcysteine O-methyltransferase Ste14
MYKYRGYFTVVLFILLLLLPAAEFEFFWIPFFVIAFFLRVWARMNIGEHTRGNELACPEIAKTGPYKYIRHPLYLSNFMAGAAFALFHAGFSFWTLGFCAIYGIFLIILAHKENIFLKSCHNTPPHPSKKPFKQSIINDRYTWIWQIVMIMFIFLRKNLP